MLQFSGMGTSEEPENTDPVYKLRQIVKEQYKTENKHKKAQKGGFAFLAPVAIAGLSTIAGKLSGDIYDWLKKKVTGSGMKIPYHKTRAQKIQFMKEFINSMN